MQGYGRYSVTRRLLAATLSLVLVLASMIGAHAHAADHGHHNDHGVHGVSADSPEANDVADNGLGQKRPNSAANHASCGDLLCHGGFAILTGQIDCERTYHKAVNLFPCDDTRSGSGQWSLDRPPRVSVLV